MVGGEHSSGSLCVMSVDVFSGGERAFVFNPAGEVFGGGAAAAARIMSNEYLLFGVKGLGLYLASEAAKGVNIFAAN